MSMFESVKVIPRFFSGRRGELGIAVQLRSLKWIPGYWILDLYQEAAERRYTSYSSRLGLW